jgi:hypothetical protein
VSRLPRERQQPSLDSAFAELLNLAFQRENNAVVTLTLRDCKSIRKLVHQFVVINDAMYAKDTLVGSPGYFKVREICAAALRAGAE